MKHVIEQALQIAADDQTTANTGHLLLAMMDGKGTVSKLLRLRGLTEPKVKGQLKELNHEPETVIRQSVSKARQIAAPFNSKEPSPLHLLAAVAGMHGSSAVRAMKGLGIDNMAIRTQALRCLTGVTEEHSASHNEVAQLPERNEALPMAEQLKFFSPKASERSVAAEPTAMERPVTRRISQSQSLGAKELIDLGRELEQKQRRKRATQTDPQGEVGQVIPLERTNDPLPKKRVPKRRVPKRQVPETREPETPVAQTQVSEVIPISRPKKRPTRTTRKSSSSEFVLSQDKFPLLSSLGRNLSAEAAQNQLDQIVGRTREMERIADVLNKRRANSPCIVGQAGVGKTALVEGLAARLASGEAPGLSDRVIIEVRPADLLSGTSVRGALSERLRQLVEEVGLSEGRVILFFDEFHAILASSEGAEAIQELKVALGRGELPCIAATTDEEYGNYIEADPALARRFTPIEVGEPTETESIQILEGIEPAYSDHHGVEFTAEAIEAAVKLSTRYINDRALPDKAIALMDLAGARARRENESQVEAFRVASVLAEQLDVPVERLATTNHERLLNLESNLSSHIIGHEHVLEALGETLRRNAAGFRTGRPIGSFLFLGPTGVGKTETAKALSSFLFPGSNSMVRLDMSEFSEAHAVARLIGAPPGYVGHEEGGQLTQAIKRRPYSLVLLDEIEKAHPDVLKVLLQVLDDGRLTDGLGRTVVFENTVIVMTSNLGSDLRRFNTKRQVGFGAKEEGRPDNVTNTIFASARAALPPELWNRIDEPLVFNPLSRAEVASIAELMLENISAQLHKEHNVSLDIGEGTIDALVASGGYDPDLGARPMRRTIARLIEGPVARMVLSGETKNGEIVTITGTEDGMEFESR